MVIFTVFKDKREGGQRACCVRRRREGRGRQRDGKIDNVPKIDVKGRSGRSWERSWEWHGKTPAMGCGYQLSVSKKEMYVEVPKRYSTIN